MRPVKSKNRFIPRYEDGSNLSEISKYIRSQIGSYKPYEIPKGLFGSSYALQGSALGSQILGLAGQREKVLPFTPNPSDTNAAFKPSDIGKNISLLDNFFGGQQRSLTHALGAQGMASYDIANSLAKPIQDQARTRSEAVLGLTGRNEQLARDKAQFNIGIDQGINQAVNQENANKNQKLAMISDKFAQGAGAFGELNNQVFANQQAVEQMNNAKLSSLMNQLFMVNYLDKLYPGTPPKEVPIPPASRNSRITPPLGRRNLDLYNG